MRNAHSALQAFRVDSILRGLDQSPPTLIPTSANNLLYQPLHIRLPHIKLAILRQVNRPVRISPPLQRKQVAQNSPILRLHLPRVPQNPHVHKQIPRRHQAPRQIHVHPRRLHRGQQLAVPPRVLLLLRAQRRAAALKVRAAPHPPQRCGPSARGGTPAGSACPAA